jgi:hypothetical protein
LDIIIITLIKCTFTILVPVFAIGYVLNFLFGDKFIKEILKND